MPEEQWRPVPGHPDYQVSDRGRVVSYKRGRPRELRGGLPNGYRQVRMYVDGARSDQLVHRLVLLAFVGPCPEGQEVRHLDGDKTNNHLSNLRHGTRSENTIDQVQHGVHGQSSKTKCSNGHAFDEKNTYVVGSRRHCRQCGCDRGRAYRIRRALAAANVPELAA